MREPDEIRSDCARKLEGVEVSAMFKAVLACLLDEVWTTPQINKLQLSPDGGFFARLEGHTGFDQFLGAEKDLIRNIHGVAKVAALDGDEVGYLVGKVAEIKRLRR
jgi:hypothetical protein